MSRFLVTGAAGLVGFEMTRQLLADGHGVVAIDNGHKGGLPDLHALAAAHPDRASVLETDLGREPIPLAETFDAVLHFAAIVGVAYVEAHPYETLRVNLLSSLAVTDYCRQYDCGRLVFASSSEAYAGGVDGGWVPVPTGEAAPLSVTDVALPRWSYAASKIAGEAAAFAAGAAGRPAALILRLHNVYGPRMPPTHVIPELLLRCRHRVDPFALYGAEQTRSFLYVEDAARAIRLALERAAAAPPILNIGSDVETRIADLAELVFATSGFRPGQVETQPPPAGSVSRRVPDVQELAALGFTPDWDLAAGLRECWAQLCRSG